MHSGQGAQMGLEDAGTMAWLLKELCVDRHGKLTLDKFGKAVEIYEKIRIPRTGEILDCSKQLGQMEELREDANARDEMELMIQGELMMNGTLPIMFQGATHHYQIAVRRELKAFQMEEELQAMEQYMPGSAACISADEKRNKELEEEERRLAFEILFYGSQ